MLDSYEKFKRLSLPERKIFYSSLKDGKRDRSNGYISDESYQHLQNVYKTAIVNICRVINCNILYFSFVINFHNQMC